MPKKQKKKKVTVKNFKRRIWEINPIERIKPSKKRYKRLKKIREED